MTVEPDETDMAPGGEVHGAWTAGEGFQAEPPVAQKQPPALPFAPTRSSFAPTSPARPRLTQLVAGFKLAILTWVSAL